jgi:hypothetical protein
MNFFQRKQETSERRSESSFLPKVTTVSELDENGDLKRMTLTIKDFEMAFDRVENDPRAGQGLLTKKQELMNEFAKLLNTCDLPEPKAAGSAAPLLSEPKTPAPRSIRAVPTASRSAAPQTPAAPVAPTVPTTLNLNLTNEAKAD